MPSASKQTAPGWASPMTRLRTAAICVGLTLLVFTQSAGFTATDTKLDLVADPWHFLWKSLTLWDPAAGSGQLGDQAYGYLFPMGPFFLLGHLLALPAWVTQRGWESAVIILAFLGVMRLGRLLGVSGFWPRVAGGLAYALSPRMLSEIGVISSELLPMAALPWMLVPLVSLERHGNARRAALRSAVAVLLCGGINASATLAVLPVPALWILCCLTGRLRRRVAGWWLAGVALASLWWLVPLLILGKYSPPFLDWIESASTTTSVTSLFTVLRGVDHWQSYLGPGEWPAGWILVAAVPAVLATTVVSAGGLAGLRSATPAARRWLWATLLLGLVLLTCGYAGPAGPLYAGGSRALLDGALNAFRNLHKFDPLVRLPLSLGVGFLLAALRLPRHSSMRIRSASVALPGRAIAVGAVCAVGVVAIAPAVTGRLVPQPRADVQQAWWTQTGQWLAAHGGTGRALVVPGAAQPTYIWGQTRDDALQPAARSPWAVRDATPLGQPGYVRMLDDIEQRLAAGRADTSLATLLATAGIRYVVVRNDLDAEASRATSLVVVHASLESSPGFALSAGLGPLFGPPPDQDRLVDQGAGRQRPAVEIYQNARWDGPVALSPLSQSVGSSGSGENLGALVDRGLAGVNRPVLFGAQAAQAPYAVATDGLRRREFGFGSINQYSATLTPTEPFTATRAAHDYLPAGQPAQAVASYDGAEALSASSQGSDATAVVNRSAANSAFAAVDGDPRTAWLSGSGRTVGQWWQVNLDRPVDGAGVQISFPAGLSDYPSRLRITTSAGAISVDVSPDALLQPLNLPPGPTQFLRLSVEQMAGGGAYGSVGLSTVSIPGVVISRTIELPGGQSPDVFAFDVAQGYRSDCLAGRPVAACDPTLSQQGEEDQALDRSFELDQPAGFGVAATVRSRPGPQLDALLDAGQGATFTASSRASADPRERPGAVFDGLSGTGWIAAAGDVRPTLTATFTKPRLLRSVRILTSAALPAARPSRVTVTVGGQADTRDLPKDGTLRFGSAVMATSVRITMERASVRTSASSLTGKVGLLPVGISELSFDGPVPLAGASPRRRSIGCDAGLSMLIDGSRQPLAASATVPQLLQSEPLLAVPCRSTPVALGEGAHRLRLESTASMQPSSVTMTRIPVAVAADQAESRVLRWANTARTIEVRAESRSVLVVRENYNAGWTASVDGRTLSPLMVNGWQQGWIVPAGVTGRVQLSFRPQAPFVAGLLLGLAAALVLLALAWGKPSAASQLPSSAGSRPGHGRDRLLAMATVAGLGLLCCGWAGLVVSVAVTGAVTAAKRSVAAPPWAGAGCLIATGLLARDSPLGHSGGWFGLGSSGAIQLGCLAAVVLSLLSAWDATRHEPERLPAKRLSSGCSSPIQDVAASTVAEAARPTRINQKLP